MKTTVNVAHRHADMDPARFRELMSQHAASVAALTVADGEHVRGVTISSLIGLSLDPPLVLFALRRDSTVLPLLDGRRFGLTLLSNSQQHVAEMLARPGRPPVAAEWLEDRVNDCGAPTLAGGAARLTASLFGRWAAGDHVCIAARVLSGTRFERLPLLHFRRHFATLASCDPALPAATARAA